MTSCASLIKHLGQSTQQTGIGDIELVTPLSARPGALWTQRLTSVRGVLVNKSVRQQGERLSLPWKRAAIESCFTSYQPRDLEQVIEYLWASISISLKRESNTSLIGLI